MRVILIGGYGFIGGHIGRALVARGHTVIALGRDPATGKRRLPLAEWHPLDLNRPIDRPRLTQLFAGARCLINASGALQSGGGEDLERVQDSAVRALADCAVAAGVERFVQLSAAGADPASESEFLATKGAADTYLAQAPIDCAVLRPGLVIARDAYGGTALIRMAAAVPFCRVETGIAAPIRCVAMDDVVAAVVHLVEAQMPVQRTVDLVEKQSHTLDDIIAFHRQWLELPPPYWTLKVGRLIPLAALLSDAFGHLGWRSPLRSNAISSLRAGVTGDPAGLTALLGRPATSVHDICAGEPLGPAERMAARASLLLPLALASLVALWVGSGILALHDNAALTVRAQAIGLAQAEARALVIAAALVDVALGAMLCVRRFVGAALAGMAMLTIVYLCGATFADATLWLDPLAPLIKVLPMLVLLGFCAAALDRR